MTIQNGQLSALLCYANAIISAYKSFITDRHITSELAIRTLEIAFVSKYHFIRSFKAEVGITPHEFQLQNRIRKAQRLMRSSKTITEVALSTGFCDQSHFIKQFEKQVGLPPLTYKLSSQTIQTEKMS